MVEKAILVEWNNARNKTKLFKKPRQWKDCFKVLFGTILPRLSTLEDLFFKFPEDLKIYSAWLDKVISNLEKGMDEEEAVLNAEKEVNAE